MDSATTQLATIGLFVLGVAFLCAAGTICAVVLRKAKEKKTHEPYAGKTLGL